MTKKKGGGGFLHLCLSALSGLIWGRWDERCRCRTSADPPPGAAAGRSAAGRARAGASDRGCPPPARSACPWVERRHCGCRRSRPRQCCHLDGLRSPLEGKLLWCFWGSLLPSCWLPRRTRTPVWRDNCFPSYIIINSITTRKKTNHRGGVAGLFAWIYSLIMLKNSKLAWALVSSVPIIKTCCCKFTCSTN